MGRFYLLVNFCLLSCSLNSFGQTIEWAKSLYSSGDELAEHSTTDPFGNLYVTGTFRGEIKTGNDTLKSNGEYAQFFIKYNSQGEILWAKSFICAIFPSGGSVTSDAFGNIYLGGSFISDSISFDSYTLVKDTVYGGNMFLVKFDPLGNVSWAIKSGPGSSCYLGDAFTNEEGSTYITGLYFNETFTFGTKTISSSGAFGNIFIAKVNTQGTVLWVNGINSYINNNSNSWVRSNSVTVNQAGDLYLSGAFSDSLLIINGDTIARPANQYKSGFIVKYSTNGDLLWLKSFPEAEVIKCDLNNDVVFGGSFNSPSITVGTTLLQGNSSGQYYKMFVGKMVSDGTVLWAKTSGNADESTLYDMDVDYLGNIFIVGTGYNVSFDNNTASPFRYKKDYNNNYRSEGTMRPPDYSNFYIVSYSSNGEVQFAKEVGGDGDDNAYSITTDNQGFIYFCGAFTSDSLRFGNTTLINSYIYMYNSRDMFVAKINPSSLGIKAVDGEGEFKIYPNPCESKLTIELNELHSNNNISIYDLLGNCILSESISSTITIFDLTGYAKGVYFIGLTAGDVKEIKKVVVN